MAERTARSDSEGLSGLRRPPVLGDLLFLFDVATEESVRLRPIADRLGVTVQAASHTFRNLARRGLADRQGGRYRPTVRGVAWLHRTLRALSDDVFARQQRLPIVRTCRAVASARVEAGEPVVLELVDGVLTVRPGVGAGSRGQARTGGPAGALLDIEDLEGILRIVPGEVRIWTLASTDLDDPALPRAIARALTPRPPGLLGARGLEATHLTERAVGGPVIRYAAGAAAAEAARVGVPSTLVVLEEDLARLLEELPVADRPRVSVGPVTLPSRGDRSSRIQRRRDRSR